MKISNDGNPSENYIWVIPVKGGLGSLNVSMLTVWIGAKWLGLFILIGTHSLLETYSTK